LYIPIPQMKESGVLQEVEKNSYQELMEEAQRLAHFGGWEVDLLTGAVKWSAEMYQMLGYDPRFTNASFNNFVKKLHREDVLYVKRNLERLLKYPSSDTYDFRIVNKDDNTIKYLRTGIIVKRDSNGLAIRMTGFSQDITSQKLAERKIENVHRELNTFFDIIDDVFYSVDLVAYKVIQISRGCEKLYGYTEEELLADFGIWHKIYHPDDSDLVDEGNAKLARGETMICQYRIIRKNKEIRWAESKVVPTLDKNGIIVRFDGVTRDITERKNAELEHQRTEKRYRQIVESAQEGIWTIDENNHTNFVNKKMCDILGYSPDEMMGKEVYYFMDDDGIAFAREHLKQRRKGTKENFNLRYINKSGRHVWANITANPIFDEYGIYRGALAMVTDITERLRSEEQLKKSEANLRTILDTTDIGYVFFNNSSTIVSFNSQAKDFYLENLNYKIKIGTEAFTHFPMTKRNLLRERFRRIAKGEVINYETNYCLADNQIKWYEAKWVSVLNDQREQIGVLLTFKNITEKKLLEIEGEKITADLVQRNKDLEQFNYMVSHNLRAPVANIIGLTGLLDDQGIKGEDMKYLLSGIELSVKNLDSVISDMNGVLQLKESINETRETTNLAQIVNEIKITINNIVTEEDVHFKCNFAAENIFSIRSYIYSIFNNLILNSIKFRKPEILSVITIKSSLRKNIVEITFADNGKGIDLANHGSQLFGLYKRFDNTMEGKGMGLFMVKTQIESLGGTITVKSEIGKGTKFTIRLPRI